MASVQNLPPVPYNTPIIGQSGLITVPWQAWFRQLFARVGGSIAPTALTNPMTSIGDSIYGGSGGSPSRLPGNTTIIKKFLTETGTGSAANPPVWTIIQLSDLPLIPVTDLLSTGITAGFVATADGAGNVTWAQGGSGALSISGTRPSPIAITASGGIISTANARQLIRIIGNGGPVTITATKSISAGITDGQELILEGSDITNTVTISGGSGTEQATTMILGVGDKIAYLWNAAANVWTEQWRISLGIGSNILTDDAGNPLTDNSGNPLTA